MFLASVLTNIFTKEDVISMDFRPCETLFFCDNFLTLGLIGFYFSHESFQLKRHFLSIWFVNKKLKFRGPVIDS